jgi:hypothetical protein
MQPRTGQSSTAVELRDLAPHEMSSMYSLRCRVYDKTRWLKVSQEPCIDDFDQSSVQFGYFSHDTLVGSARLTVARMAERIPCGRYLQDLQLFDGTFGELSRQLSNHNPGEGKSFEACYVMASIERSS